MKIEASGFGTILFLIFLVLKLTHYIDWSWWWIFAPFWLPIALIGAFLLLLGFCKLMTVVFN